MWAQSPDPKQWLPRVSTNNNNALLGSRHYCCIQIQDLAQLFMSCYNRKVVDWVSAISDVIRLTRES